MNRPGELFCTAYQRKIDCSLEHDAVEPLAEPRLVYLFIIDETGSRDFLELVRNAISAAVHGLPDGAYVGTPYYTPILEYILSPCC